MAQTEKSLRDLSQAVASRADSVAAVAETEADRIDTLLFGARSAALDKGASPPAIDSVEGDIGRINDALSRIATALDTLTRVNARVAPSVAETRASRAA